MKTNLQELRKAAGYKSAKAYAAHMGMNYNTYTDYEQGRIALSLETAWTIADDLGCTLDELAGRTAPTAHALGAAEERLMYAYVNLDERGRAAVDAVAFSLAHVEGDTVSGSRRVA